MIKGTPITAETLHINHQASYGIFCFNEQGDLFVNSDYGAYCYAWRSYGPGPFRDFLAGVNPDYMVGKFETNFIEVSGKRSLPTFRKEKLLILCAEFIKTLKEQPAPVQKQELVTRLYNLVNAVETTMSLLNCSAEVNMRTHEARETLKKVIQ